MNEQVKSKSSKIKSSQKSAKASQSSGQSDKLKTVVRRLPPNLPEDIFWQSVQTWVSDDTVTWKAFYPGKIRKKYVLLTVVILCQTELT